jgi:adenine phosphoribosyltransferase
MTKSRSEKLDFIKSKIRDVPDFPKPGIVFKDITPLLSDHSAMSWTLDLIAAEYAEKEIEKIIAMESRGFIFGCPLADRLKTGFVPIRKPGKLPWKTESATYELEYGTDTVEIHADAVTHGQRVLVVDDLLATGGTAAATVELLYKFNAVVVGCAFVIELAGLQGRKKLGDIPVTSLITY